MQIITHFPQSILSRNTYE